MQNVSGDKQKRLQRWKRQLFIKFTPDDSFLMEKRCSGRPHGRLCLSPLLLLNCALLQHLTNAVSRPATHTSSYFLPQVPGCYCCLRLWQATPGRRRGSGKFLLFFFYLLSLSGFLQVPAGAGGAGGEQGGPGGGAGGVSQRGPGAGRGLGLPLYGDLCQEQDHGGRALCRNRAADGFLSPAGPEGDLLPRLQRAVAGVGGFGGKLNRVEIEWFHVR